MNNYIKNLLIVTIILISNINVNAVPVSVGTSRNTATLVPISNNELDKYQNKENQTDLLPAQEYLPQKIIVYQDYQEIRSILKDVLKTNGVESKSNLLQSMETTLAAVDIILALIAVSIASGGFFLVRFYKNVNEKLKRIDHLSILDEIDELTKIKISAIQKTLILCLDNAPERDTAFSTYSKLLQAYEVLLDNSYQKITPKIQEEMEMKATLVYGNKQYVPKEIIRFMIENMNLPYEVRGILWGKY